MKVPHNLIQGNIGIAAVDKIISGFGWLFREQSKSDLGIDAHVEITQNNRSTGCLLGLQIKSGRSYFKKDKNENFRFYFDSKHRNYWLNYSLPVILILYDSDQEIAYWQSLDRDTVRETRKSRYRVTVPSNQILNNSAVFISKYLDKYTRLLIDARKKWLDYGLLPEPETLSYLSKKIEPQKKSRENLGFILCATCAQREAIEEWSANNEPFSFEFLFYYLCGKKQVDNPLSESISLGTGLGGLGGGAFVDPEMKVMCCLLMDFKGEGLEIFVETTAGSSTNIRHIPPGTLPKAWEQFDKRLAALLKSIGPPTEKGQMDLS